MTTIPDRVRARWQALQQATTPQARAGRDSWYRMATRSDAGARTASIDLYGAIGGWWSGVDATRFVTDLRELDVDEITVHINSPGGDVFDGIAIMNALRQHPARVVTVVDGLAASAASFIAVGAGDEVVMARNAELFIHDAWGFAMGNAGDMRQMGDELDRVSNNIARVYSDRTGGTREDWRQVMVDETWFDDAEAVAAGLADRVLGDDEVSDPDERVTTDDPVVEEDVYDRFDLSVFAHAGRRNAPAPRVPQRTRAPQTPAASASGSRTTPTREGSPAVAFSDAQLDNLRRLAGVSASADEGTILAALDEALTDENRAPSTAVPDGMALVDNASLDALRADASAGREAREQQRTERRESLVNAAVKDGRIAPARREAWLNMLTADPGAEETLAGMPAGLVPLNELGHAENDRGGDVDADLDVDLDALANAVGLPKGALRE